MKRMITLGLAATLLSGCQSEAASESDAREISITQVGQQSIDNRTSYESLGDVTFTATVKYLIKDESGRKDPQLLFGNVTMWAGKVLEQETQPFTIPLEDGEFEFECAKYVDVKINQEDDWGPLRCELEPIALFSADALARLSSDDERTQGEATERQ